MSIRDYLRNCRVPFETLLHGPMPSATRVAHSLHVPGRQVAKSVLLRAGEGYVLAVLPATHRVDLGRIGEVLAARDIRLATEDELERVFVDCERGAVPPFGKLYGVPTVVDTTLAGCAEIVVEGNARHEGVRMRYRDYEAVERPTRARFASAITPRLRRESHRRAG
jgi:Ala-tRNA(Pro) deacylase